MSTSDKDKKRNRENVNESSPTPTVSSNYKWWFISFVVIISISFVIQRQKVSDDKPIQKERLFTHDELKKYTNNEIYLAILGHVFNVSSAPKFYSSTGSYKFFSGRDASRSFHTGGTSDEDLTDDLTGFDDEAISEVYGWLKFYQKQYPYLGKVIGRYFDSNGEATENFQKIFVSVKNVQQKEEEKARSERKWPSCNSEWSQATGRRVWCTEKSGGVERAWAGVPRRYFDSTRKTERCVCIENPDDDNGHLKHYKECPPTSTECKVLD